MKNNKQWEVLVKFDDDNEKPNKNIEFGSVSGGYEISVIKKNNILGHKSWGWASSEDKIILFGCGLGETNIDPLNKKEWDKCIKIANCVCDLLNSQ